MIELVVLAIALPVCSYLGIVLGEALVNLDLTPWRNY